MTAYGFLKPKLFFCDLWVCIDFYVPHDWIYFVTSMERMGIQLALKKNGLEVWTSVSSGQSFQFFVSDPRKNLVNSVLLYSLRI